MVLFLSIVIRRFYSLLACFVILLPTPSLTAEFYRWVDSKGVVHFTDNLHQIPEGQRSSATRIKAREAPRSADSNPKSSSPDKISIPIEKNGQVVTVEATINQKTSARFVVDTGASYTMISSATAKELDIDISQNRPTIPFQTANGIIQAPLVSLESIDVGGMEVRNLTAAIHDIAPDSKISGLLGLNFLSSFRMDIDTDKGMLHLEKK
jgi:clan AA aspartic protease (TIGR02281 family)